MNDTGFPIVLTPLAVDETQAAKMLGISVRTLWEYRKNGEIPVVRCGRLVRFSVDDCESLSSQNGSAWYRTRNQGNKINAGARLATEKADFSISRRAPSFFLSRWNP